MSWSLFRSVSVPTEVRSGPFRYFRMSVPARFGKSWHPLAAKYFTIRRCIQECERSIGRARSRKLCCWTIVSARLIYLFIFFFNFCIEPVVEINSTYQYTKTFHLIDTTIKIISINIWGNRATLSAEPIRNWLYDRHRTNLSDTPPSLCRKPTIARRRALAFRRGGPARIVECTSEIRVHDLPKRAETDRNGPKRTYENTK